MIMEKNKEGEKENYSEVEKIKLIDFSSEDDILVDYPFRDSLEDLRLSGSFFVLIVYLILLLLFVMHNSMYSLLVLFIADSYGFN